MRKFLSMAALLAGCGAGLPEVDVEVNARPEAHGEVLGESIVNGGAQVSLSATRSTDADGDVITYRWIQVSGAVVELQNDGSATSTFVAPEKESSLVFGLVVNDGYEDSERALVQVDVRFNTAPVAEAGPPAEVLNKKSIVLAGKGDDDDGDPIAAYEWTVDAVPVGAAYQISGTDTAYPSFTPQGKGVYTLGLRVSDGKAWSLKTAQLVTSQNNPPTASPWYSGRVTYNTQYADQGVDYDDPDGDPITQWEWSVLEQPPGSSYQIVDLYGDGRVGFLIPLGKGVYKLGFRGFDGEEWGPLASSTVIAENNRPTASIGPADPIANFATVYLNGGGSDLDGDFLTYTWTVTSKPAGASVVLQNGVASPAFKPSGKGSYVLQLVVSDGQLASAPVTTTVVVNNTAPTADPGPGIPSVSGGTTVQLDGTASRDPDGDGIALYKWTQLSGAGVSLSVNNSAGAAQPAFTPTTKGTYQFRLEVHDGTVWSTPAYVSVVVDNLAPQAVAPNDFAVLGRTANVALNGTAVDGEGDLIVYAWTQVAGTPVAIVNPAQAAAAFTAPALQGTLTFRLTASDGKGSASDTVNVTVGPNNIDHVFVDDDAPGGGNGTMQAPLTSVQSGIAAAVTGPRSVVIAAGSYPGNITLANGVNVYGGYATGAVWTRTGGATTILQTPGVLNIVSIPATVITATRFDGVAVRSAATGSSTGVVCNGCSAVLNALDVQLDSVDTSASSTGIAVRNTGYPVWISGVAVKTAFTGWSVGVELTNTSKTRIEDSNIDVRGYTGDGSGSRIGVRSEGTQNLVWLKRSKLHLFQSTPGAAICNAIRAWQLHADSILESNFIHAQCFSTGDYGSWPQYNAGILWWNKGNLTVINNTIVGPGSSLPGVNSNPIAYGVYENPAGANVMRNNYFNGWDRVYNEYEAIHTTWTRNYYGSTVGSVGAPGPIPAGLMPMTCPLADVGSSDLHLAAGANPCVDAGATNANPVVPYDVDRQPRTFDDAGTADFEDGTDIGADER